MGTGICSFSFQLGFSCLLSMGMGFFKCHWEWDFLNASGNGGEILKIATGISRYFVNGNGIS